MKRILTTLALVVAPMMATAQEQCVVLLHGLARTEISFAPMALVLESNGYKVVNSGYPSTEDTIQRLVDENLPFEIMNYPGAKHGLTGRKVNLHRYSLMDRFFDQHLGTKT